MTAGSIDRLALAARNALEDEYGLRQNELNQAVSILVVFTVIAAMACVMRLLALTIRQRPVGADDWSMLVAFLSMIGTATSSAVGLGKYNGIFTGQTTEQQFLKTIFAYEVLGSVSVSFVKISILFLYLRIAGKTRTLFWWSTVVTLGIVSVMTIVLVVMCFVQCAPFSHMFDLTGPGTCLNMTDYYYVIGSYLVVSDLVIVAMPVPMLLGLNRPAKERIVLVALFAVMLVPVAASVVRIVSQIRIGHLSSSKIDTKIGLLSIMLSTVELDLGIACACAPSIKALIAPRTSPVQPRLSSERWHSDDKSAKRVSAWRSRLDSARQDSTIDSAEDGTMELITTLPRRSQK